MRKLFLFLTFFLTFFANSCSEDEVTSNENLITERTSPMNYQRSSEYTNLTDEEISNIGTLHNEILTGFVKTLPNKDVKGFFMNYEVSDLTPEVKEAMMHENYEKDLSFLKENLQNPEAMEIMNSVLDQEYNTLEDLSSDLNEKKYYAKDRLKGVDLDAVLVFLEVYESSATFWENNKEYTNNTMAKITTRGLIGADGIGAAGGIMRFIVVAAPIAAAGGPIGVGMLISAVGWSAAWASASYLVVNYH